MTIIRDCEAKRLNEIRDKDIIIEKEQQTSLTSKNIIDELRIEIKNHSLNIKNIKSELQVQINECENYKQAIEKQNIETVQLKDEASKMKQKAFEDV